MTDVYIGLGSNLGDGRKNLLMAWEMLASEHVVADSLSSPYESRPVGFESNNWFVNAVGRVKSDLAPDDLLARLLAVEKEMGRVRSGHGRCEDRIVDLDILFYGDRVISSANLRVPHPEAVNRLFVLRPLVEIAPLLVHPETGSTASELLEQLTAGEGNKEDGQEIRPGRW